MPDGAPLHSVSSSEKGEPLGSSALFLQRRQHGYLHQALAAELASLEATRRNNSGPIGKSPHGPFLVQPVVLIIVREFADYGHL